MIISNKPKMPYLSLFMAEGVDHDIYKSSEASITKSKDVLESLAMRMSDSFLSQERSSAVAR